MNLRDDKAPAIALVVAHLGCGGTQRVVSVVANEWAAAGRDVTVVTLTRSPENFFALHPRVRRIIIDQVQGTSTPHTGLFANLHRVFALRRALRSIDAPFLMSFIAPTNVLLVLAAIGLGRRTVISERNNPRQQSFGPVWDGLRRWTYRWADVVTANSREALEALQKYVPDRKLAFLPNPIVLPTDDSTRPHRHPTVLSVGRLSSQKAHDVLIDAFAQLVEEQPSWRLVILGEGPERHTLERKIEELGIKNYVDLAGTVNDPSDAYRSADIFALASRHEGTPNALLEAMAYGLPPIVSNRGAGALELVADGDCGLVVAADDSAALQRALHRLMNEPSARCRLGKAAQARVANECLDRVLPIWDEVLGLQNTGT